MDMVCDLALFRNCVSMSSCNLWGCMSQGPRGPRHELSSPAKTLGSWVRIPLEAWVSLCVYSVLVLSCVQVVAFRRAGPHPRSPADKNKKTEKAAKPQQMAVEP
jgi:hypothetical protein